MTETHNPAEQENTAQQQEIHAPEIAQVPGPDVKITAETPLPDQPPQTEALDPLSAPLNTANFGSTCAPIPLDKLHVASSEALPGIAAASGNVSDGTTSGLRGLSIGERTVGITFNPSFDPRVDKVKALFAEAIDLMYGDQIFDAETLQLRKAAQMDCLRAQMMVVKFLTYKP